MRVHEVAVILDAGFGGRLLEVASRMHAWVVDSPQNRPAIEQAWAADPTYSAERGVTRLSASEGPAERRFAAALSAVEDHHGWHGHSPPWTVLHCIGVAPTDEVRSLLAGYGVDHVLEQPDRFIATRPVPALPG